MPRRPSARLLSLLTSVALTAGAPGCGDVANPTIADEFHARLSAPSPSWKSIPCRDRAAKLERIGELVALAWELRALLRDYDDPIPPRLHTRILAAPLTGTGADYRCVIQDFAHTDVSTGPDLQMMVGYVANVLMLKADLLMKQGEVEQGWAHVLEALALHGHPHAAGLTEQLALADALQMLDRLLRAYPPPASAVPPLVEATEATLVSTAVACAGFRHDMLLLGIDWFRDHFGQREREAVARRFGLDRAMRSWRAHRSGALGLGIWTAFRTVYDLQVEQCTQRPFGRTIAAAAKQQRHLLVIQVPVGQTVALAGDKLVLLAQLRDHQIDALAALRARMLYDQQGRWPTTAELAVSFGKRPRNPWDGRYYTFAVQQDVLSIVRGSHTYRVELDSIRPR